MPKRRSHRFETKRTVLDARTMVRVIRRMAGQIVEKEGDLSTLMLVGIRTRGLPLARRIANEIAKAEGVEVPIGALDITLYRDDLSTIGPQPVVRGTDLPIAIEGREVVLCDDVLFTGRTVRAALDELKDFGRPRAVRLAVLVDRGHRELPIQPDVIGQRVESRRDEQVEVAFQEVDGEEHVRLKARVIEPDAELGDREGAS